jgi:high-affinity K+ transport system ATPase subunit B
MAALTHSLFDRKIMSIAARNAFRKLSPRHMLRNPVMFVVLVGSLLTTLSLVLDIAGGRGSIGFTLQITLWLWFTVLFANFAEARPRLTRCANPGRRRWQSCSPIRAIISTSSWCRLPGFAPATT